MPTTPAGAAVTRPVFWGIGPVGEAVFYYLAAVALALFAVGVWGRLSRYARGAPDPTPRLDRLPTRVVSAALLVVTNARQFDRDRYAGIMHTLVVWGFLTLLIGTTILAIDMELYQPLTGRSFFVGTFYLSYSFVMDAMGLLFVVGVGMALYRRYVVRADRLHGPHTGAPDHLFVWSLFLLGTGGYLLEGVRIRAMGFPPFETVSFVGWFVAETLAVGGVSPGAARAAYPALWWSHALVALAFVAAVPHAKFLHLVSSFANLVARDDRAGVRLPRVPEDTPPEAIGPSDIDDFSWKQLLDHDACTNCGRCTAACPAAAAGRPLDPREVILDLRDHREAGEAGHGGTRPIVGDGDGVIDAAAMESCVSCLACVDACPVGIEHVTQFTEMNRRLVESGRLDPTVQEAVTNTFQHGNAFGEPARGRPAWTDDLAFEIPDARETPVEYLWYVGDFPSYDERNRRVARSLARLFDHAGISYGILYEDERNDGNDVRRVGEEGLYELLAEQNIEQFADCTFDAIVCTDPHAYNTFRNEYDQFGFDGEVIHYTQLVERLVASGTLSIPPTLDDTVTYHDPCHLGRFNGEYDSPRALIRATGCHLVEMPRNRRGSFCCGGGGGGIWLEFDDDPKPSEERLREATEDTAGMVEKFVVACPQCVTMFEDGRKTGGYEDLLEIVDIAELLVEALETADGARPASRA